MDEVTKPRVPAAPLVWVKLAVFCAVATAYVASVFWLCRTIWNFIV